MANYSGVGRTNYVTIIDVKGLKKSIDPFGLKLVTHHETGKIAFLDDDADGAGWPTWSIDFDDNDIELDIAKLIMPFVAEGEVLVVMESGHEKQRYISGWAEAFVRKGDDVQKKAINLRDIYTLAAEAFDIPVENITEATY